MLYRSCRSAMTIARSLQARSGTLFTVTSLYGPFGDILVFSGLQKESNFIATETVDLSTLGTSRAIGLSPTCISTKFPKRISSEIEHMEGKSNQSAAAERSYNLRYLLPHKLRKRFQLLGSRDLLRASKSANTRHSSKAKPY